jgi:AI-2 transport protein TqsA
LSQTVPLRRPIRDRAIIRMVATYFVIAATAWYLLKELAPVLRPLLVAVFLAYIILPVQAGLARRTSKIAGFVLLGLAVAGACALLAALSVRSAANLVEDLPHYTERVKAMTGHVRELAERWPWLTDMTGDPANATDAGAGWLRDYAGTAAGTAADVVTQSLIVGVYLLFVLLGAAHLPQRIQSGFEPARSEQLLAVLARINVAISSYLRAKVLAGLALALPATIIIWAFGVKSALFWGVLTFMLSFIPYVGSAIAWTGPTALAFLDLEPGWKPIAVAILLGADHALSAYLVDPALTGKAVDLSPLVILLALAFWGLCWGLEGMLLAVPLTVVVRIILDNLPATRPIARMMGEG